jgi:hypothetical protein
MITIGQKWMSDLKAWILGKKHPETPVTIYKNVYEYDRVRRILLARCTICDYVVSRDADAVRELAFVCHNKSCRCNLGGSQSHQVCNLCYDMHHALYTNYLLTNINYFRNIDEIEKNRGRWK